MSTIFDNIIITAPGQHQLCIYSSLCQVIKKRLPLFNNTNFHVCCDPKGLRVGSGGGTINAINYLVSKSYQTFDTKEFSLLNRRVLIVHSGGDSRRSPMHSVCGKAWATINSPLISDIMMNPLVLILLEFNKFFTYLPLGSIVVASGDVLLDITKVRPPTYISHIKNSILFTHSIYAIFIRVK